MTTLLFSTIVPTRIVVAPPFEDAVAKMQVGENVILGQFDRNGTAFIAALSEGQEMIGWLPTADSNVPKLINGAGYRAQVRKIVRGRYGERFEAVILEVTTAAETLDVPVQGSRSTDGVKSYAVGIVGEANFQPAIRSCAPGDRVDVMHETGNPYDGQALAVVTGDGATIGYIAKSSWLRDAIHDEEQGCEASIRSIQRADGGEFLGVVLDVTLNDDILGTRAYAR